MKHLVRLILVALGLTLSLGADVLAFEAWAKDRKSFEIAQQLEKAAYNRGKAALLSVESAMELLDRAEELRMEEYFEEEERQENFRFAGDLCVKAADLEARAVGNLDKAAEDWSRVAVLYKKVKERDKERHALSMAESTRGKALDACARAADAYERAADAYSIENGNSIGKMTTACERAAEWREKLSKRK